VTGKIDYNLSPRHAISGSYLWNRDNSDRPDAENDYSLMPKVTNPTHANLVADILAVDPHGPADQRSCAAASISPTRYFLSSQQFGSYYLTGTHLFRSRE
jgi:hypothetical protein